MDLRKTLTAASEALIREKASHALIGGFALAVHEIQRATQSIDFLADGSKRDDLIRALQKSGFVLEHATAEVLHFSGIGQLDILLANRPLTLAMLTDANAEARLRVRVLKIEDLIGLKIQAYCNDPSRELQDKADIQKLMQQNSNLDWPRIKKYADLFDQWNVIENLRGPK